MAVTAIQNFSEARVPGADGAYTKQTVVKLADALAAKVYRLEHGLGRIPDWVRVTPLAHAAGIVGSYLNPVIRAALDDGRFEWEVASQGSTIDLTRYLLFAAFNSDSNPAFPSYYMVEYGITHSASK